MITGLISIVNNTAKMESYMLVVVSDPVTFLCGKPGSGIGSGGHKALMNLFEPAHLHRPQGIKVKKAAPWWFWNEGKGPEICWLQDRLQDSIP